MLPRDYSAEGFVSELNGRPPVSQMDFQERVDEIIDLEYVRGILDCDRESVLRAGRAEAEANIVRNHITARLNALYSRVPGSSKFSQTDYLEGSDAIELTCALNERDHNIPLEQIVGELGALVRAEAHLRASLNLPSCSEYIQGERRKMAYLLESKGEFFYELLLDNYLLE